jgi:hypothetical protein
MENSKILPEPARRRFAEAWSNLQADFVDNPEGAITGAARLARELIQTAGIPVDHPRVAESYRAARTLAQANLRGEATLDDLREAIVHYRALFAELLQARAAAPERGATEVAEAESRRELAVPAGARG